MIKTADNFTSTVLWVNLAESEKTGGMLNMYTGARKSYLQLTCNNAILLMRHSLNLHHVKRATLTVQHFFL